MYGKVYLGASVAVNYLVPMLQDKQAKEEEGNEGDSPS
jgi:hypothetical protein